MGRWNPLRRGRARLRAANDKIGERADSRHCLEVNFAQGFHEAVNVCLRVERPRTYAGRSIGKRAERTVDVGRTVKTRTDGDVKRLIENASQLRGGKSGAAET